MNPAPEGFRPLGTLVLAAALIAAAGGLVLVAIGPWRLGVGVLGASLVVSAVARTLLPERHSGLLHVRRAPADVLAMALLGAGIVALALLVPDQPRM